MTSSPANEASVKLVDALLDGISVPGYGEHRPDEFGASEQKSVTATFICDLKALDKLNMERGDVPGVFGWLNSPLEELAEVVLTGAFEDCYGDVTEDQIELAHFSNCSKDGNMLKFTVTYDISLDGAGVSQVMSDLRNLDKVEYLKLSGKVTHA